MTEIERVIERAVVTEELGHTGIGRTCDRCGDKIKLWWNGGELDWPHNCSCGRKWSLEHGDISLVVTEPTHFIEVRP